MTDHADTLARHTVGVDEIAAAVRTHWQIGIDELHPFGGEVDTNLGVMADDGRRLVAKVGGAATATFSMQARLLAHVAGRNDALPVPGVIATIDGSHVVDVTTDGGPRPMMLVDWLPGRPLSDLQRPPIRILHELGAAAASLSSALADFTDPALERTHEWDLRRVVEVLEGNQPHVTEDRRRVVDRVLQHARGAAPSLADLPEVPTHHDLNDANVLAETGSGRRERLSGIIDPGDALLAPSVCELAIAVAYAMLRQPRPMQAADAVVHGWTSERELPEQEAALVLPLALARLAMNASTWTRRIAAGENVDYATRRSRDTWRLVEQLSAVPRRLLEVRGLLAAGHRPGPRSWPSLTLPVGAGRAVQWLDLQPSSTLWDELDEADTPLRQLVDDRVSGTPIVAHGLARLQRGEAPQAVPATHGLAVELLVPEGTEVVAPCAGRIARTGEGVTIVADDRTLVLLHGVTPTTSPGVPVAAAQSIGTVAPRPDELGPRVGIQLLDGDETDLVGLVPAVAGADLEAWACTSPDPAAPLGLDAADAPVAADAPDDVLEVRRRHFAPSQKSYFDEPPLLVRAKGVWFHGVDGRTYLDPINNVTHVGHGHPHVARAVSRQFRRLNTNSRLLYAELSRYADRLCDHLPDPLDTIFFVCTGSEANDLASRIIRTVTGRDDVLVIDGAYHGNTTTVMDLSPDRFDGPGGAGAPPTTHKVEQPNAYRGRLRGDGPEVGPGYAQDVATTVERLVDEGRAPAGFFAESLMGTGGEVVLPPGYLSSAFASVRAAGGLCVSDEVQVGFGRLGPFWGFETHGVVPDVVTMGKPMGNGFPIAAVATSREIAEAFDTGMRYFNTFGGNPVACAAGMAVLDVLEEEELPRRAQDVARHLFGGLRELADRHELIGDVRHDGLYGGVELVRDRETLEPATAEARQVCELLKAQGVLMYPNGRFDNVLKLKPPMVFEPSHADRFVEVLDDVLSQEW